MSLQAPNCLTSQTDYLHQVGRIYKMAATVFRNTFTRHIEDLERFNFLRFVAVFFITTVHIINRMIQNVWKRCQEQESYVSQLSLNILTQQLLFCRNGRALTLLLK